MPQKSTHMVALSGGTTGREVCASFYREKEQENRGHTDEGIQIPYLPNKAAGKASSLSHSPFKGTLEFPACKKQGEILGRRQIPIQIRNAADDQEKRLVFPNCASSISQAAQRNPKKNRRKKTRRTFNNLSSWRRALFTFQKNYLVLGCSPFD